jgi:hypothetical protein
MKKRKHQPRRQRHRERTTAASQASTMPLTAKTVSSLILFILRLIVDDSVNFDWVTALLIAERLMGIVLTLLKRPNAADIRATRAR